MSDNRLIPNVLSIAGSDPSGGAGIQADIKAISANVCYAMAVIAGLTAQNTRGVTGVRLVEPEFVVAQIDAVFADVRVDAVKVGMLGNAEIASAVAEALARHGVRNLVLDPVMIAKGGDRLLDDGAVAVLREQLLPITRVLTPNLPEAAVLLGCGEARDRVEMAEQAERLCGLGARNVLLKGGHLAAAESPDVLCFGEGTGTDASRIDDARGDAAGDRVQHHWFEASRVDSPNTHGTGCTLSSALAAQLARTGDVLEATRRAKAYIAGAIAHADRLSVGSGHGPTHHFHALWRDD